MADPRTSTSAASPVVVERLLTYKQAGELLGVTDRTVWTLVNISTSASTSAGVMGRDRPHRLDAGERRRAARGEVQPQRPHRPG